MIANKVDEFLWTSLEPPLLHFICIPSAKGHQFIFAEYSLRYSKGESRCVYKREIYSTEIFTLQPTVLLREIIARVNTCVDALFPVELVYQYGGTVQGNPITMAPIKPELIH